MITAQRELDALFRALERTTVQVWNGDATWEDVRMILARIDYLESDTKTATNILGRLSPWVPHAQYNAERMPHVFTLALKGVGQFVPTGQQSEILDGDRFRYPQLEKALEWLEAVGIATREELEAMSLTNQLRTFAAPNLNSPRKLQEFKNRLEESFAAGESLQEFKQRIKGRIKADKREVETAYRTNTKRSYVEGLESTLNSKPVANKFPYVLFNATDDNRVRDWHWELDGFVALKGSSLYSVMMNILREHQCRCNVIPLTERRAQSMGINTVTDLSPEFRLNVDVTKYGAI